MTQHKYVTTLFLALLSISVLGQIDNRMQNNKHNQKIVCNKMPKPIGVINDFENLLTSNQELELDSIINLNNSKNVSVIGIVTIDKIFTSSTQFDKFSLRIAKKWGLGQRNKNNGVLICISKCNRRIRINNGTGLENIISNCDTKEIIDKYFVPYLKKDDYYNGTLNGLINLIAFINSHQNR